MALFVDIVNITVKAGDGGNGCVSFHRRNSCRPAGRTAATAAAAGDVKFLATERMHTLMDFRFKRKFFAENGMDGLGQPPHGQVRRGRGRRSAGGHGGQGARHGAACFSTCAKQTSSAR